MEGEACGADLAGGGGLKVPRRQPKRGRLASNQSSSTSRAERPAIKALCPGLGVFATVRDAKTANPLTNR